MENNSKNANIKGNDDLMSDYNLEKVHKFYIHMTHAGLTMEDIKIKSLFNDSNLPERENVYKLLKDKEFRYDYDENKNIDPITKVTLLKLLLLEKNIPELIKYKLDYAILWYLLTMFVVHTNKDDLGSYQVEDLNDYKLLQSAIITNLKNLGGFFFIDVPFKMKILFVKDSKYEQYKHLNSLSILKSMKDNKVEIEQKSNSELLESYKSDNSDDVICLTLPISHAIITLKHYISTPKIIKKILSPVHIQKHNIIFDNIIEEETIQNFLKKKGEDSDGKNTLEITKNISNLNLQFQVTKVEDKDDKDDKDDKGKEEKEEYVSEKKDISEKGHISNIL